MIGARRLTGRGSRGAALIEFALILPLILMLLVGMVSAGIAYNHQLSLTHAAREAGRYGATLPINNFDSMDDWLEEVRDRAIENAAGSLGPGVDGHYVCVAFVHPAGSLPTDSTKRLVDDGSGDPDYDGSPCFADDRPNDERRVQVAVRRTTEFSVVFFSRTLTLSSEGVSRFEAALEI